MNLHEYQAKEILKEYGVPIPRFGVAANTTEIQKVIRDLGLSQAVVKIQVQRRWQRKGWWRQIWKNS
jgi:succinyl-CoA synthetase beta subunit